MRATRTEQLHEPYERGARSTSAREIALAERLARALDVDDVVTVVGLLALNDERTIAGLPASLLDRLHQCTAREIAAAWHAKRATAAASPVPLQRSLRAD